MVVGPGLDVRVREEEDGEDDRDAVELGEDQSASRPLRPSAPRSRVQGGEEGYKREGVDDLAHLLGVVESREGDHGWDLKQADLESVG